MSIVRKVPFKINNDGLRAGKAARSNLGRPYPCAWSIGGILANRISRYAGYPFLTMKGNAMKYEITQSQFKSIISTITKSKSAFRESVQKALVAATYLCLKNSGGTTPFQQILDAVGTTAHRQGITKWAETFAPVQLIGGKLVLNKTAYKELDVQGIAADFDAFVAESGMMETYWDTIAKDDNTTVSVFNLDTTLNNFLKKLEKNDLPGLAAAIREAEQAYMRNAIKQELTAANEAVEILAA